MKKNIQVHDLTNTLSKLEKVKKEIKPRHQPNPKPTANRQPRFSPHTHSSSSSLFLSSTFASFLSAFSAPARESVGDEATFVLNGRHLSDTYVSR